MIRGALLLVAATLMVSLFMWQDQRSVERGNRLYRAGDAPGAVEIYRNSRSGRNGLAAAEYNLGTALLRLDPDSAETFLRRATRAEDRTIAQRGLYNLGYRLLTLAQVTLPPDSATAVLTEAVASYRAAFRLDPTNASTRWNLALAQRRLDAIYSPDLEVDRESSGDSDDEVVIDDLAMARSESPDAESALEPENPRAADNTGERQGAREGAREAWATQDPGPMTTGEALGLLVTLNDRSESLIRGILWSHRPPIAWWEGQAYPGGPW